MNRSYNRKLGDPVDEKSMEEIRRLTEMPDELINTDDIPERPVGQGRRIYPPQKLAFESEEHRKAS